MFGLLVSVPNFSWNDFNSRCPHVPILDNGGTGLIDPKIKKRKKLQAASNKQLDT